MSFLQRILAKYQEFADEALSMAYDRKEAIALLKNLHFQIAWHLFLIAHYPQNEAVQHWSKELRGWNGQLRLHNKASRPRRHNYTRALLMKALWDQPLGGEDERREFAAQIADDKELPLVVPDEARLKALVSKFVDAVLDPTPGHKFSA